MVSILREGLEVYGVLFNSGWFWLAYSLVGIRRVWLDWDAHRDQFLAAPPALAAIALILGWASWPMHYINRSADWIARKIIQRRDRRSK